MYLVAKYMWKKQPFSDVEFKYNNLHFQLMLVDLINETPLCACLSFIVYILLRINAVGEKHNYNR